MLGWNRKKDKEDDKVTDEVVDEKTEEQKESSTNGPVHAMGDGDVVPEALSKKLAEIRGQEEPDFEMVEVDKDGNPIKTDEDVVKEDEVSSDEVDDSQGVSEEDKSESEDVEDTSEYEHIELDPRLEAAGKKLGWSEDKIIKVAETDISILEDLANQFEQDETHRQDTEVDEEKGAKDKADLVDEEALAKFKKEHGDAANDIVDVITRRVEAKFADQFKKVDDFELTSKEKALQEASMQRGAIANDVFDRHVKTFKEFGLTKDLPKSQSGEIFTNSPAMTVRAKVYKVADMFHQTNGGSFESAMNEALTWYAGTQGVTNATRQVVKDLKDNQKRFSPKPTRRRMVKVFKNTDAKAANIVQQARKKAGIE
ncbi:hypothetical protein LCGC14_0947020 [marine sediment metagenome]|uniref:Uncharacterized protein n=1 Tax=marine sediment metagenome TaxID=412755 RepID=A0A0F9RPT7_9ZZZZ